MNLKKNNKFMALTMALTMVFSLLPVPTWAEDLTESKVIYLNDFEESKLPDEVGGVITASDVSIADIDSGNKAIKFTSKFDGTDNWDKNKHEFGFYTAYSEEISAESEIQFDILIPTANKNYGGQIKYSGGLADSNWGWIGANYGDINSSDFVDLGNGFSSKAVSMTINSKSIGLNKVFLQVVSYNCNYSGDIYLDNIKVIEKQSSSVELPTVQDLQWSFNDTGKGVDGWADGGSWDYHGTPITVGYDENIGQGAMKVSVDYSKDTAVSWSEIKVNNALSEKINFNGYNVLTYDFIYNPSNMTQGAFNTKLFINSLVDQFTQISFDNVEDLEGGLKKARVAIEFTSKNVDVDSITLGIIGSSTNYVGDLYIDNIKFGQVVQDDIYVEKTEVPATQSKVNIEDLNMPSEVKLVDSKATETTADLYSYLLGVGKSDKVLYGHQNDTHHKAVLKDSGTNSDTKDITGSIAAIVGIDTLSLTGAELQLTDEDKNNGIDLVTKAANLGIDAANEGGILTLSAHMPNFAEVAKKDKIDGQYDYSGYSPGVTTGDVVNRIMPGGDLNEVYNGYLDIIAAYGKKLEAANVPVLFRPLHENNGSWFWWGKAFCDEQAYKNLFAYTVEYLRDTKEVHNFLYVYSPNGPFEDEADYLSRYPGDEFIDIIAFDMYHDNPAANPDEDPWMDSLKETIELVQGIADARGKLSTVSETGIRINYGFMPTTGNVNKDWFKDVNDIVSASGMPYYMVWANFGEKDGFYSPYMVSDTKGHEMINEFIEFYNDEKSVFADRVGNYSEATTTVGEEYSYGYIAAPSSRSRVLSPATIMASVKNLSGKVSFVIKDNSGKEILTLDAKLVDGLYKADLTQEILDQIGETIGTIDLYCDNALLNSVNILFNIEETEAPKNLVDDFESYYGESTLLKNVWTTNAGPGCYINPGLNKDNLSEGKYGLAFNYKISTAKTSEGWAGITRSIDANWSEYDSLQFWITPDGYGQKLVIQITTNGEDFEVWMPELAATKEPQLITLPFSQFKGKNGGAFDAANVEKFGIWCNTIVPSGHVGTWTVESKMYFDDIKAIDSTAISEPTNPEEPSTPTEPSTPGDNGSTEEEQPSNPQVPTVPSTPEVPSNDVEVSVPVTPSTPNNTNTQNNTESKKDTSALPKTGGVNTSYVFVLGVLICLVGAGVYSKKNDLFKIK